MWSGNLDLYNMKIINPSLYNAVELAKPDRVGVAHTSRVDPVLGAKNVLDHRRRWLALVAPVEIVVVSRIPGGHGRAGNIHVHATGNPVIRIGQKRHEFGRAVVVENRPAESVPRHKRTNRAVSNIGVGVGVVGGGAPLPRVKPQNVTTGKPGGVIRIDRKVGKNPSPGVSHSLKPRL